MEKRLKNVFNTPIRILWPHRGSTTTAMFEEALLSIGLLVVAAKLAEGVLQRFGLSPYSPTPLRGSPLAIKFAVDRARATAGATDRPRLPASTPPSLARYALENVTVRDMLDRSRSYPQSEVSVRIFNEEWANPNQQHYVVVDKGAVSGIVSLTRLRFLPESAWDSTSLRNVLRLHTPEAWPDELIDDVLERMTDHSLTVIPIKDRTSGNFLGAVTSRDILDQIMMQSD